MSRKILLSILVAGLSLVCGSLLSSDTYAAGVRLGSYIDFRSYNLIIGADVSAGIEHNKDYNLTASGNNYIFIANGHFIVPSSFNFKSDTKYYLTIVQNFKSQVNGVNGSTFLSEPFDIYNNFSYTLSDDINSSRSCSSSSVCNFTFVHNIVLQGIGNGTANFSSTGNLFSTSGWTSSNSGTGVFNWTGFIFEDYDEWLSFRSSVVSVLNGIHSDTTDIVNLLESIDNSNSSIESNIQSLKDAQDQANNDANDRYQDEKDTIDNNVSGGIDSVDNIDKTINLPSPLAFFLGTLSVSSCYDISTLAGMVGSSDTQYCSWFSSNTRSIMTPFIDVVVFITVSMFIWSWVKKGGL